MSVLVLYGADSGLFNTLAGIARKALTGRSGCALCTLTHGLVGARPAWQAFMAACPDTVRMVHADEVAAVDPALADQELPAIVCGEPGAWRVLVGPDAIAACRDADALVALVQERLD